MGNSHDEIKKLIKASQNMFRTDFINADIVGINNNME